MKLSAKKRSEIYDLVHEEIMKGRMDLANNYMKDNPFEKSKVDFVIAQMEIPLAQKIIKLLDKTY